MSPPRWVEALVLVVERQREQAEPVAIRGRGERLRERRDDLLRQRIAGAAGVAFGAKEEIDRLAKILPAPEPHRQKLRVQQGAIGLVACPQAIPVHVERRLHVATRLVLGDARRVAAFEQRNATAVRRDEREPVEPQIDVCSRGHGPGDSRLTSYGWGWGRERLAGTGRSAGCDRECGERRESARITRRHGVHGEWPLAHLPKRAPQQ